MFLFILFSIFTDAAETHGNSCVLKSFVMAIVSDPSTAKLVDMREILKEPSITRLVWGSLVNTNLAEVIHHDIFAQLSFIGAIGIRVVVHSTVFTIRQAVLSFKIWITRRARPVYEFWLKVDSSFRFVSSHNILPNISHEKEGSWIVGGVPHFHVNFIIRVVHFKISCGLDWRLLSISVNFLE